MTALRAVPGYTLRSSLSEGQTVSVWRATRNSDALPVVIKTTKGARPHLHDVVRLKQEYEVARNLPVTRIVHPLDFVEFEGGCALVLEETEGMSLQRAIRQTSFPVEKALSIAAELAGALGEIHSHNVVHKDIKPANIIIGGEACPVRITDFGIASVVLKNAQDTAAVLRPEGTLAYISPEQTGRMNCRVDWRSDLYSLGVTLFELFTGRLPFPADDPLAQVHAHIAKVAPPACEVNPQLPQMIAAIIAKLMAKSADERYQSAAGLKKDLLRCLETYRSTGEIPAFPLGRYDISDKFRIPHKLYGREKETGILLSAFQSAAKGRAKMVAISGFSGVGKSALVHELERPIIRQGGYFVSGKFEQFNLNIPYSSLIQAFRELIRRALTASGAELARLREIMIKALGENAQVIVNVIPELAAIVGPQPAAPELPAAESQSRFTTLFLRLTQVFASKAHPLCIFLDDLQWADQPSLKLIADIMVDNETSHLLLLGAYRDNEVDSTHPLVKTLSAIAGLGVDAESLFLTPLGESDICTMIQETFSCSREEAAPLSEICARKTAGNPFFLSQFLRKLYEEGVVAFDFLAAEWRWEIENIRRKDITDNVVTLMTDKISLLPERGKNALKLAACVGNSFSLSVLAVISGRSSEETFDDLKDAIKEGLVVPAGAGVSDAHPGEAEGAADEDGDFRFLHDRVQQAAYSLFGEEEKREAHLMVGRLMLINSDLSGRGKQLFDIVSHLNKGASLITDPAERMRLAWLNLRAGKEAKSSGAFEPAYRYFEAMMAYLPPAPWESDYALALDYHLDKGEVAYLCGNYDECYALCNAAFMHVREMLDRARVNEVVILAKRSEGKNRETVSCALGVLEDLGMAYPAKPKEQHLILPMLKTKWLLTGRTDADLLALPPLEAPHKQAILRVMTKAASSTYITNPLYSALWILAQMEITLKYGRSPITAYTYSVYGLLLCGGLRQYDEGNRFARLAGLLVEHSPTLEAKGKTLLNNVLFAQLWRVTSAEAESVLWKAYEYSLTEGDPEFAAVSLYSAVQTLPWYFGENLAASGRKAEKYAPALKKLRQERVNQWSAVYRQTAANCMNAGIEDPTALTGEFADEAKILENFQLQGDKVGQALFLVNKLILCCIFREFEHAPTYVKSADEVVQSLMAQLSERQYHLYSSLALFAILETAGGADRRGVLKRGRKSLGVLRAMESASSAISHHGPVLLEAEIMRIEQKHERAAELYDQAIHHAKECHHHYEEALANELCGRFYLAREKPLIAEGYLSRAFIAYRNWGAVAKLVRMHSLYPGIAFPRIDLLQAGGERRVVTDTNFDSIKTIPANSSSSSGTDRHLDLETVLKATRAISGEIVLHRLLEELLRIVLENAGAQRGVLLLDEDNELVVEGEIGNGKTAILQSAPLNGYPGIPRFVVNYVRRTQNSVVLDDAAHEGEFSQDPYLSSGEVRSVLCMPILNKGDFTGMLYLENNCAPGAFTLERLEVLKVIAAQIAISIENARLYESIEKKVDERTQELQEKTELLNQANKEMAYEIEQRKKLEEELRKQATIDSLTGLLLRRRFFELGETEINRAGRTGSPLSLMVLDIDHFKSINDTFGHAIGDEVLIRFSEIFRNSLRTVDIVCRFGGEEFVALLPDTDIRVATEVAQRLRRNVEAGTLSFDGVEIRYTISVGLTGLLEKDTQINQLIKRADEALYRAKKAGRNRAVVAFIHTVPV